MDDLEEKTQWNRRFSKRTVIYLEGICNHFERSDTNMVEFLVKEKAHALKITVESVLAARAELAAAAQGVTVAETAPVAPKKRRAKVAP